MKIVFRDPVLDTYPEVVAFWQAKIEVTRKGIVGRRTLEKCSEPKLLASLDNKNTLSWRIEADSIRHVTPIGRMPAYFKFEITDE